MNDLEIKSPWDDFPVVKPSDKHNETTNKNIILDDSPMIQSQRNQLHQFNYYFIITFHEIINNVVYYKLSFGRTSTGVINRWIRIVRFSELYKMNICSKWFPSRTLFKHTSQDFITQRINDLKTWIDNILKNNEGNKFYDCLLK